MLFTYKAKNWYLVLIVLWSTQLSNSSARFIWIFNKKRVKIKVGLLYMLIQNSWYIDCSGFHRRSWCPQYLSTPLTWPLGTVMAFLFHVVFEQILAPVRHNNFVMPIEYLAAGKGTLQVFGKKYLKILQKCPVVQVFCFYAS